MIICHSVAHSTRPSCDILDSASPSSLHPLNQQFRRELYLCRSINSLAIFIQRVCVRTSGHSRSPFMVRGSRVKVRRLVQPLSVSFRKEVLLKSLAHSTVGPYQETISQLCSELQPEERGSQSESTTTSSSSTRKGLFSASLISSVVTLTVMNVFVQPILSRILRKRRSRFL